MGDPPGEVVPLHTHRWPATLYVLESGHFVRRDESGDVLVDTRGGGPLEPEARSGASLFPRTRPRTSPLR